MKRANRHPTRQADARGSYLEFGLVAFWLSACALCAPGFLNAIAEHNESIRRLAMALAGAGVFAISGLLFVHPPFKRRGSEQQNSAAEPPDALPDEAEPPFPTIPPLGFARNHTIKLGSMSQRGSRPYFDKFTAPVSVGELSFDPTKVVRLEPPAAA